MTTYAPVNETTKYSEDVLFTAAEKAAEDIGLRPVSGEGSTTFDTREKEVATSSIPRLSYKFSFHVETTGGVLVITANCSKNSTTNESTFGDCGDDRPERVVDLQAALMKHTLERAKTEQARSPDFAGFGEAEHEADAGKASSKDDDKASSGKGASADDKKKADDDKTDSKDSADKGASKDKGSAAKDKAKPSSKKK